MKLRRALLVLGPSATECQGEHVFLGKGRLESPEDWLLGAGMEEDETSGWLSVVCGKSKPKLLGVHFQTGACSRVPDSLAGRCFPQGNRRCVFQEKLEEENGFVG